MIGHRDTCARYAHRTALCTCGGLRRAVGWFCAGAAVLLACVLLVAAIGGGR